MLVRRSKVLETVHATN